MRLALALLLLASACIDVPDGPAPECKSTSDCDRAAGEVCEDGTCWGNPPPGPFAALVSPPTEHLDDLVSREIQDLPIPDFGWIGDISLDEPVNYSATLRAVCPPPIDCTAKLTASIRVSRPSLFAGGPGFRGEQTAQINGDAASLVVPRTRTGTDQPYTITVVPEDNGPGSSAEVVPPMRFIFEIPDSSANNVLDIGANDLPQIDGTVQTAAGVGLAKYRVVAVGRWDAASAPTEVSTVFYTGSDGKFTLHLSPDLPLNVELVARPYEKDDTRPTFHLGGVAPTGGINKLLVEPALLGKEVKTDVQITGVADTGEVVPLVGAHVLVTAVVPPVQQGASFTTIDFDAITGDNGIASFLLRDGSAISGAFKVSVIPPASSLSGVVFEQPLRPGATNEPILLPNRVALRGIALDINGDPLAQASVTARPSLRFQWSLPEAQQAFLTAIPAATTVTPDTGEFVVFVDPVVAEIWGFYDLTFEPSSTSRSPTYVMSVEIPRNTTLKSISMPDVVVPDAAFVHGRITDPGGNTIAGAELKLFHVETGTDLCALVPHAPASCPIPAALLGRGAADKDGVVELRLPR